MNVFAHLFCRLLLHILAFTLSSSLCLAAESDDVRRKDIARPTKTGAASTGAGRYLPPPSGLEDATRSTPRRGTAPRASKATFRSVRRLMRTRRLLLAALRVWELKNGYRS